ncbi:MAG: DNA repair protein RecN [Deltaproteobacteria bacterium]|nr:DNA repair protein RecN [Deltaproteobacteria bacterium]RLA87759.1 MAG: DNA repair protein RecN [Deltaproteobacteria bacterium]
MLKELYIKNLAIIDKLNVEMSPGLNIITGETGAGKSIILGALNLVMGNRFSEDMLRRDEEQAIVEAVFDLSNRMDILKSLDFVEEGEPYLIVRRILSRSGKSRTYINDHPVTLKQLSEIMNRLISISGQNEYQRLLDPSYQLEILDKYGDNLNLRERYKKKFELIKSLEDEYNKLNTEKEKIKKEKDLYIFQIEEIDKAKIEIGEEKRLKAERKKLINAETILKNIDNLEIGLYSGDNSVTEFMHKGKQLLKDIEKIDPSINEISSKYEEIIYEIEDIATFLRNYKEKIELDPKKIEEVESRLFEIEKLKRKYGLDEEGLLNYREKIWNIVQKGSEIDDRIKDLGIKIKEAKKEVDILAKELSNRRKEAAKMLNREVQKELNSLDMKGTRFETKITSIPDKGDETGIDKVEFMIQPNIGESLKPLSKIASGGELSRIMLALNRILIKLTSPLTLVFDEVDAGIGGKTASVVGKKLKELGNVHQVVCVTHLPQVASFGDSHFRVFKQEIEGRTSTKIQRINEKERIEELARMVGGDTITEKTLAHARELLAKSKI